jgi:galactokinase
MNQPTTPSEQATAVFTSVFGRTPEIVATAPGRVNLIGEHTDYNDGFVLPVAINFHTAAAASARDDRIIEVVAHDEQDQRVQFSLDALPVLDTAAPWSNYIRGVVGELLKHGFTLCGANLVISGNVPMGAGLSSSASLEMAVIAALARLSKEPIEANTAALLGQAAENNFVGCNCGIMDQLISAAGRPGHALMLDCRSLQMQTIKLPAELSILVIDSKVQRQLVDGEYNERRRQCEEAARHYGVSALRDLTLDQLINGRSDLDGTTYRRARHVVTENQRTLAMANALQQNQLPEIARLMAESHNSMRDDFTITIPEIDHLVDIVKAVIGNRGGVRMTGGGFGGCVVALLPNELVTPVLTSVESNYRQVAKQPAVAFVCQSSGGAFNTETFDNNTFNQGSIHGDTNHGGSDP